MSRQRIVNAINTLLVDLDEEQFNDFLDQLIECIPEAFPKNVHKMKQEKSMQLCSEILCCSTPKEIPTKLLSNILEVIASYFDLSEEEEEEEEQQDLTAYAAAQEEEEDEQEEEEEEEDEEEESE